nr:hypothetical protein [Klebsiella pneumoniae]
MILQVNVMVYFTNIVTFTQKKTWAGRERPASVNSFIRR